MPTLRDRERREHKTNAPRGLRTGLGPANLSHTPGRSNDGRRPCRSPDLACAAATPQSGSPREWPRGHPGPPRAGDRFHLAPCRGSPWTRSVETCGRGPVSRHDRRCGSGRECPRRPAAEPQAPHQAPARQAQRTSRRAQARFALQSGPGMPAHARTATCRGMDLASGPTPTGRATTTRSARSAHRREPYTRDARRPTPVLAGGGAALARCAAVGLG